MRPIIGITMNTRGEFSSYYVESVERAGGCPVVLSSVESCEALLPVLDQLNGIIFSGGTDINPFYYDDGPRYGLDVVKPSRDRYEFELIKMCFEEYRFPMLGICRGMQLLNIFQGGNMYQCLEKEKPQGLMHTLMEKFPLHYPAHAVEIEENSKLFELVGKNKVFVNSLHHQGIKEIGAKLKKTAWAPDGLIEGVEMPGDRFVVAVQWHPEMMTKKDEYAQAIFRGFVRECIHSAEKVPGASQ